MMNQQKNIIELRQYFQNMSAEEFKKLILNKKIMDLKPAELNIIFLNISDDKKMILLSDNYFYEKVITLPPNRLKKEILDLISEEVRTFIFNSKNLSNSILAQEKVKKYRSSFRTTLYIKGSNQKMNKLQDFLETFDFHIVVIGDTSFDFLGRIDKKVVVLPIQKF